MSLSSSDESNLLLPPAQRTGRLHMSYVWDYFSYNQDAGRSTSTVLIGDDSGKQQCATQFVGKYPTNLKNHLKKSHTTEFKEMEKKELARKEATTAREGKPTQVQPTIMQSLGMSKPYEHNSPRNLKIVRKLAVFVGGLVFFPFKSSFNEHYDFALQDYLEASLMLLYTWS